MVAIQMHLNARRNSIAEASARRSREMREAEADDPRPSLLPELTQSVIVGRCNGGFEIIFEQCSIS